MVGLYLWPPAHLHIWNGVGGGWGVRGGGRGHTRPDSNSKPIRNQIGSPDGGGGGVRAYADINI
jgi:hypothetical protein